MAAVSANVARASQAAVLFAALGDATRLNLVDRLATQGPLPVMRLAQGLPLSRQAVTKHLQALEEAGLVSSARAGRERIWALRAQRLAEARRHLDRISGQWDQALGRLRAFVETPG